MDEPRVRISDIAEELGLSTATVSNVLHGKTKKISDETVKRVMSCIEERQYLPGVAELLMAQNAAKIVGVFLNDHEKYGGHTLEDAFIASSLNALSAEIERSGRFMMVKRAKDAEEIIRFAAMWNMDGIVTIGFCEQDYAVLRSRMRIPFVVYDGFCDSTERICNLTLDDRDGGAQVGRHLRELGHRRALCVADNETGVDRQRFAGFCAGFAPGEAALLRIPMEKAARWAFYRQELPRLRAVTAVFAVSDHYAMDLICFLHSVGIAVPEAISVAGFDDIPLCESFCPTLTTVRQPMALRARLALEKLDELRVHRDAGETLRLPVTLVARESTAEARKEN